MGLNSKKIKEKFGIQIYTNDPRIGSLCKKYGVKDKWELIDVTGMVSNYEQGGVNITNSGKD